MLSWKKLLGFMDLQTLYFSDRLQETANLMESTYQKEQL